MQTFGVSPGFMPTSLPDFNSSVPNINSSRNKQLQNKIPLNLQILQDIENNNIQNNQLPNIYLENYNLTEYILMIPSIDIMINFNNMKLILTRKMILNIYKNKKSDKSILENIEIFNNRNNNVIINNINQFVIFIILMDNIEVFDGLLKFIIDHKLKISAIKVINKNCVYFPPEEIIDLTDMIELDIIEKINRNYAIFSIYEENNDYLEYLKYKEFDNMKKYVSGLYNINLNEIIQNDNFISLAIKNNDLEIFEKLLNLIQIDVFTRVNNCYIIFRDIDLNKQFNFYQCLNKYYPPEIFKIFSNDDIMNLVEYSICVNNFTNLENLLINHFNLNMAKTIFNLAWNNENLEIFKLLFKYINDENLLPILQIINFNLTTDNIEIFKYIVEKTNIIIDFAQIKLKNLEFVEFDHVQKYLAENFTRFMPNTYYNFSNNSTNKNINKLCCYDSVELFEKLLNHNCLNQFIYSKCFDFTLKNKKFEILKLLLKYDNNRNNIYKIINNDDNNEVFKHILNSDIDFLNILLDLQNLYRNAPLNFKIIIDNLNKFNININNLIKLIFNNEDIEIILKLIDKEIINKNYFSIENIHLLLEYENIELIKIFSENNLINLTEINIDYFSLLYKGKLNIFEYLIRENIFKKKDFSAEIFERIFYEWNDIKIIEIIKLLHHKKIIDLNTLNIDNEKVILSNNDKLCQFLFDQNLLKCENIDVLLEKIICNDIAGGLIFLIDNKFIFLTDKIIDVIELIYNDNLNIIEYLINIEYIKLTDFNFDQFNIFDISNNMKILLNLPKFDIDIALIENKYDQIMNYLQIYNIEVIKEVEECSICKDTDINDNGGMILLSCGELKHFHHLGCLYKWIREKNELKCVYCTKPFEWKTCKKVLISKE